LYSSSATRVVQTSRQIAAAEAGRNTAPTASENPAEADEEGAKEMRGGSPSDQIIKRLGDLQIMYAVEAAGALTSEPSDSLPCTASAADGAGGKQSIYLCRDADPRGRRPAARFTNVPAIL